MTQEHQEYKQDFPDAVWRPYAETKALGHIVVVTHNGRAPRKEDRMIDVPVSMDALGLVLISKGLESAPGRQSGTARRGKRDLWTKRSCRSDRHSCLGTAKNSGWVRSSDGDR